MELLFVERETCGMHFCTAFLYRVDGTKWNSIGSLDLSVGFEPNSLDILPITRQGYHDIRAEDDCYKWDGEQYVAYEIDDYRSLSPGWFSSSEFWNANIRWRSRYAGLERTKFTPLWVNGVPNWTKTAELDDDVYGVKWVAMAKYGVYGIKDGRSFLLVSGPIEGQYATKLEIQGDWLMIYGCPKHKKILVSRFNRRTRELRVNVDFWRWHIPETSKYFRSPG